MLQRLVAIPVLLLGFAMLASLPVLAQPNTQAHLEGRVCVEPEYYGYGNSDSMQSCNGPALPGATVHLKRNGQDAATQTTDASGSFTFNGLAEGSYSISAEHTGFTTRETSASVYGYSYQDISLAGQEVRFRAEVRDSGGALVAGSSLNLCCPNSGASFQSDDGKFDTTMRSGVYSLTASARGYRDSNSQAVVDGLTLTVRLERLPPQDVTLSGTVVDQHGKPASHILLYADAACCDDSMRGNTTCLTAKPYGDYCPSPISFGPLPGNRTETDDAGHYTMALFAGRWDLHIEDEAFAPYRDNVEVQSGQKVAKEIVLERYLERTAHFTGRVVDARNGHAVGAYSMQAYHPELGRSECSDFAAADRPTKTMEVPRPMPPYGAYPNTMWREPGRDYNPYDSGCRLHVAPDGTFDGFITPGYTNIEVNAQQACNESQDADGSSRRACGPEFLRFTQSIVLAENGTTDITIKLMSRPPADAIVSGYLLDSKTGKAVAAGQITFTNEQSPGYGYARTDADGSYSLRLRSGYHTVTVEVNGYLQWQGTILVKTGANPFDVKLTSGKPIGFSNCCDYGGMSYATFSSSRGTQTYERSVNGETQYMVTSTSLSTYGIAPAPADLASDGAAYQDLGGGLGPYDAKERANLQGDVAKGAPMAGLVATGMGIGLVAAVLALRRRL